MGKNYNKAAKSDTYTFTTNVKDDYSTRVVDEAKPETNFLLLLDHDRRDGYNGIVVVELRLASGRKEFYRQPTALSKVLSHPM
jgi:hypothetical protein